MSPRAEGTGARPEPYEAHSPVAVLVAAEPGRLSDAACRALDVVVATLLLVLLSPLLLAVALAIRLDSPGPALFRQRRMGRDLEHFEINKFRTMYDGADDAVHRSYVVGLIGSAGRERAPAAKLSGDERVTRLGHFLRRSSIDELPQLWNVVRGHMSLVGPRPPIPYEVEQYPPHWFARFAVKPGVTGLWQVSGRSQVTLEEMVALDIAYVRRRCLLTNVVILLRTIPAVVCRRGAS